MGKRLSKIYTRTGDAGDTGLGDGSRIDKTHPRIEAMGAVDELNATVGLVIEALKQAGHSELEMCITFLRTCQQRIFDLGGELSIPGFELITSQHIDVIEQQLDELNAALAPLENFIMPSGSMLIAHCHLARSVCRRAERRVLSLAAAETINPACQRYLNRLSDYLFVLARHSARVTNTAEVLWQKSADTS